MKHLFLTTSLLLILSTQVFASQIKLTWTNTCSGNTAVEVWKETVAGGPGTLYATLAPTAITYTDATPVIGMNYYKLRCVAPTEQTPFTPWNQIQVTLITRSLSSPALSIIP